MTADTEAIVAFLNERYDEREAGAKAAASLQLDPENGWGIDGRAVTPHIGVIHEDEARQHIAAHDPAWRLRDIVAKRAILETCVADLQWEPPRLSDDYAAGDAAGGAAMARFVIVRLATEFEDHPAYKESWKP
jgi:uncharacterized protein DUF6221